MTGIALQLYTLRERAEDYTGMLRKIAAMGFEGVEFAGGMGYEGTDFPVYGGLSARELQHVLTNLGLAPVSAHVAFERLQTALDAELEYAAELGLPYVVCPYLTEEWRGSREVYQRVGETLARCSEAASRYGIQIGYHNHDFEFERFDGQTGLDILFEAAGNTVFPELDLYWVEYAGKGATDFLQRSSGRVHLVHVKDMAKDETRTFEEVGMGRLNWDEILPAAAAAGAKWYIVEQDRCRRDEYESIHQSVGFVREWRDNHRG